MITMTKEKEGDLKFYGDQMTFEYRRQVDFASQKVQTDSKFNA